MAICNDLDKATKSTNILSYDSGLFKNNNHNKNVPKLSKLEIMQKPQD